MTVHVVSLTDPELGADAIVNAGNPHLGLGSGVSGAIRDACGGQAFQSLVRQAWTEEFDEPLQPEDCLVTSAGSATAFRWVLHVAAVDYKRPDPETGGPSGPSRIQRCAASAFREACMLSREHLNGQPLVLGMPLLGAGHGGVGVVTATRSILAGIAHAQRDCPADEALGVAVRFAVLDASSARVVELALSSYRR